jgi:hypothetical protein
VEAEVGHLADRWRSQPRPGVCSQAQAERMARAYPHSFYNDQRKDRRSINLSLASMSYSASSLMALVNPRNYIVNLSI